MIKDDLNQDPQQTLQPGGTNRSRRVEPQTASAQTSEPKARRLKFGTPTRNPTMTVDAQTVDLPPVSPAVKRGFTIGSEVIADLPAAKTSKTSVQPWILFVAGGAIVLLLVALVLKPASTSSDQSQGTARLMTQYTKYLESRHAVTGVDVAARQKDVIARLQAVEWAKAIGDKKALENELTILMFLDNDKGSPLYQYSVAQLKQLGPGRKSAGL